MRAGRVTGQESASGESLYTLWHPERALQKDTKSEADRNGLIIPTSFPSTLFNMLATQQYVRSDDPHGRALEAASDSVDEINIAILKAKQEADAYAQSQFDAEKNKDGFRQFVDENEGSRKFYMSVIFSSIPFNIPFRLIRPILLYSEQHTKQTVEYNLKARAEAFAKPRATLSVWEAMELLGAHRDLVFSVKHKLSPNRFCLYRHSCRRI